MVLKINGQAKTDLEWYRAHNRKLYERCLELSPVVQSDPSHGIGRPQRLAELGENVWCRRVSFEHRMVYEIFTDLIVVVAFRYHHE